MFNGINVLVEEIIYEVIYEENLIYKEWHIGSGLYVLAHIQQIDYIDLLVTGKGHCTGLQYTSAKAVPIYRAFN